MPHKNDKHNSETRVEEVQDTASLALFCTPSNRQLAACATNSDVVSRKK